MGYLIIYEYGDFWIKDSISYPDVQASNDGIIDIIKLETFEYLNEDEEWVEIDRK